MGVSEVLDSESSKLVDERFLTMTFHVLIFYYK